MSLVVVGADLDDRALSVIRSPIGPLPRAPISDRGRWAQGLTDADVPWAHLALLDLPKPSDQERVRASILTGKRPNPHSDATGIWWELYADLLDQAFALQREHSLDWFLQQAAVGCPRDYITKGSKAWQRIADAALCSPRSFAEFIGLQDDEGNPIIFKDFHCQTITAMRQCFNACILLPLEHGKSMITSIVVPLMDFSEWADATEGRIYWNESHVVKWIRRLMDIIEYNQRLHALFPWVRKPQRGDKGVGLWSNRGFAIGGRTLADRSFEPLTANQFPKGNRYARVGVDDIVDSANCAQDTVQDRLFDWLTTGAMSMRQALQRKSRYNTKWPTFFICGTLYDRRDVNQRMFDHFRAKGYKALRVDVYPNGRHDDQDVIWPEYRPLSYINEMRESMTLRSFNMRVRNIVGGRDDHVFPRAFLTAAEYDGVDRPAFTFGQTPPRARGYIGFDPGSGKLTKYSAHPAYAVYAQVDHAPPRAPGLLADPFAPTAQPDWFHHVIEWGRMEGFSFTRQCDKLAELYERFGWTIAFENNTLQGSYADYMTRMYPQVRMIGERTSANVVDPEDGVEQFEPLFRNGRMVIHAYQAPYETLRALREEFATWKGPYTDLVMALWIAKSQFQRRETLLQPGRFAMRRPAYLSRFGMSRPGAA